MRAAIRRICLLRAAIRRNSLLRAAIRRNSLLRAALRKNSLLRSAIRRNSLLRAAIRRKCFPLVISWRTSSQSQSLCQTQFHTQILSQTQSGCPNLLVFTSLWAEIPKWWCKNKKYSIKDCVKVFNKKKEIWAPDSGRPTESNRQSAGRSLDGAQIL